jgi:hypothetical protein
MKTTRKLKFASYSSIQTLSNIKDGSAGQSIVTGNVTTHTSEGGAGFIQGQSNIIKSDSWAGHAEGAWNEVVGNYAHAEGSSNYAYSLSSHAEGVFNSTGYYDESEGKWYYAEGSHAEGNGTKTAANYSHAEGQATKTLGIYSHAEGVGSVAIAEGSHAEGKGCSASGICSHASGCMSNANADYSFVAGKYCNANMEAQTVCGQYSAYDNQSLFVVGVGTSNNDLKNGFCVTPDGRAQVLTAPSADSDVVRLKELRSFIFYNQLFFLNQVKLVTPTETSIQIQVLDTTGKVVSSTNPIYFGSISEKSTLQISFSVTKVGFKLQNSDFSTISMVDLTYTWTLTYTPATALTSPKFTFSNPNLTATSTAGFMVLSPSGYKSIDSYLSNICLITPTSGNQTLIKIGKSKVNALFFPSD